MAVARGNTISTTATSSTPTLNKADLTGLADGDLLVCSIAQNGGTVSSGPTDWFQEANLIGGTNPRQTVWSHYVSSAAGEPTSWQWTLSGSLAHSIQITRYTGHNITSNGATAFNVFGSASDSATSVSAVAPDITTTVDNTMLVGGAAGNSSNTSWTAGAGNGGTEVYDAGAGKSQCFYSDEAMATAGATGTTTFTQSSARAWTAWIGAIAPASGASDTAPTGSLTLSGKVPSISIATAINQGSLSLAGQALSGASAPAVTGALTIAGQTPTANAQATVNQAALTLAGQVPTDSSGGLSDTAPTGALALSGQSPTARADATADQGGLTLAGRAPAGVSVPAVTGALTLAGQVPTVSVPVPTGALTFSGKVPTARADATVNTGALVLQGMAPSDNLQASDTAPTGALVLSGKVPTATVSATINQGALTLSGTVPTASGTANAPTGILTLSGRIPTAAGQAAVPTGALALSGKPPSASGQATALTGALTIAGQAPTGVVGPVVADTRFYGTLTFESWATGTHLIAPYGDGDLTYEPEFAGALALD